MAFKSEDQHFKIPPVRSLPSEAQGADAPVGSKAGIHRQAIRAVHLESEGDSWTSLLLLAQSYGAGRLLYCLVFKRWLDVALACLLLIGLAPLLLAVALALWLESGGPAVFRQVRIGMNGRLFVVYKFRTMIPDRRKDNTPLEVTDRRLRHKTKNDPRVTRLGSLLRRTSVDELPQLLNVIRGDMSLVGPRPELPEIVARYAPWQHQRHLVRPGLTGWWQVQGRSDLPMHENTELDVYYVVHQSFRLDVRIMWKTFGALLSRSGAF